VWVEPDNVLARRIAQNVRSRVRMPGALRAGRSGKHGGADGERKRGSAAPQ
jgi:hypothetical protein